MSYLKKIEYEIILKDSFEVIWSCPKCGRKTNFKNTNKFRINANGNKLDIWLIYQCEKCKHTLNLSIYERRKASSIPKKEYRRFLSNDEQLIETYGKDMQFFRKNHVDIDFDKIEYDFVKLHETVEKSEGEGQILITINNPYGLKIRPEKQIAEALGLSRSQIKRLLADKGIELITMQPQLISASVKYGQIKTDE